MTTKQNKGNERTQGKEQPISAIKENAYTLAERKVMEKTMQKMSEKLFQELTQVIPTHLKNALWSCVALARIDLSGYDEYGLSACNETLKLARKDLKQLKQKDGVS